MQGILIATVALCCLVGCRNPEPTTAPYEENLISPVQSEWLPKVGVQYHVVIPPEIYRTKEPGPKERESAKAWRLGNEFVFRTALRKGVTMPAVGVVQGTNDIFLVRFLTPAGKDAGFLFVHTKSNTVELSE
jgi:hypothetical protein